MRWLRFIFTPCSGNAGRGSRHSWLSFAEGLVQREQEPGSTHSTQNNLHGTGQQKKCYGRRTRVLTRGRVLKGHRLVLLWMKCFLQQMIQGCCEGFTSVSGALSRQLSLETGRGIWFFCSPQRELFPALRTESELSISLFWFGFLSTNSNCFKRQTLIREKGRAQDSATVLDQAIAQRISRGPFQPSRSVVLWKCTNMQPSLSLRGMQAERVRSQKDRIFCLGKDYRIDTHLDLKVSERKSAREGSRAGGRKLGLNLN